jgi:hypothetical protein
MNFTWQKSSKSTSNVSDSALWYGCPMSIARSRGEDVHRLIADDRQMLEADPVDDVARRCRRRRGSYGWASRPGSATASFRRATRAEHGRRRASARVAPAGSCDRDSVLGTSMILLDVGGTSIESRLARLGPRE